MGSSTEFQAPLTLAGIEHHANGKKGEGRAAPHKNKKHRRQLATTKLGTTQ